ncbi:MAG: hypothetical protein JFR38_06605 [Muribaculaceae bacterium]|nr:hypothetical protein [Muribaculaceae bacterium]
MDAFGIYSGIALIVAGCVIGLYGALRRRAELRMFVLPPQNYAYLKAKYAQYRTVCCLCAVMGVMLIGLTI